MDAFLVLLAATEAGDNLEVWKWINFLILAGGLGYLIAKNAGRFFNTRTEEIQRGITEAMGLRMDAEKRAGEVEERLAAIGGEIDQMRSVVIAEFRADGERIRNETSAQVAKIHRQAEQEIVALGNTARHELKTYSAQLALEMAGKRVREGMSEEAQGRLVDAFIRDLASGDVSRSLSA